MTFARRSHWVKRWLPSVFSRSRFAASRSVLLTFDDGPHPEYTPAVLDRLHEYRVAAAFFLIGRHVADAPDFVARITESGHLVGNHTFTHRRFGLWEAASVREDVARCQLLVPGARWFRPPFGRLTPGLWRAARRLGLECVTWTLDSSDWQCRSASDAAACAAQVLKMVRPGDIVLFHDVHRWIGPILDVILPVLAERGWLALHPPRLTSGKSAGSESARSG